MHAVVSVDMTHHQLRVNTGDDWETQKLIIIESNDTQRTIIDNNNYIRYVYLPIQYFIFKKSGKITKNTRSKESLSLFLYCSIGEHKINSLQDVTN